LANIQELSTSDLSPSTSNQIPNQVVDEGVGNGACGRAKSAAS